MSCWATILTHFFVELWKNIKKIVQRIKMNIKLKIYRVYQERIRLNRGKKAKSEMIIFGSLLTTF